MKHFSVTCIHLCSCFMYKGKYINEIELLYVLNYYQVTDVIILHIKYLKSYTCWLSLSISLNCT